MKTLLVVDAQNDFMPGGSLPVPNGDEIVDFINDIRCEYDLVIWTKDSHPSSHCSFKENGGIWPRHCVIGTEGSDLHKELDIDSFDTMIYKGTNVAFDSYSAFKDDGGQKTRLANFLRKRRVTQIDVCGLALEYCVKFTVEDAVEAGFNVTLLKGGCRSIEQDPEKIEKIYAEISLGALVQ